MFFGIMSVGLNTPYEWHPERSSHAKRKKILHGDRCRVCLHGGRGGDHAYPYMAIRVVAGVPLGWI